jgi:uncharacterized protein YajQ (UPF0234 family)
MPSFDTVCEPNLPEVKNAVDNTAKEIATRFDFKGTPAAIELKDKEITLIGDADFQLTQIEDILRNKLTKRNVDVRFLDMGDVQKIGGDKVKQVIKVKNGIASDDAKKITRLIKDSKMKVQASSRANRCASPAPSATTCRRPWPAAQGHDRHAAEFRQLPGLSGACHPRSAARCRAPPSW